MKRTYNVAHGKDGWLLRVEDEHIASMAAERITEAVLAGLGHPCCGRGPLSKLRVPFRWLREVGIKYGQFPDEPEDEDLNENALDFFWHDVLNLPNRLYYLNKWIVSIPLTREQAYALRPEWVTEREAWDTDES